MKTMQWTTIKKTHWGVGPWDGEPDKKQWQDQETGLACLIVRSMSGHLCGYVGVPTTHPWFEKEYGEIDVSVHGGLTFSSKCRTHEMADWQRLRDAAPRLRAEAAQYPTGDSAVTLNAWGAVIDDYGAFVDLSIAKNICHLPEPGDHDVWWLGFDCAHCDDLVPGMSAHRTLSSGGIYRDIGYVIGQCEALARQIKAATVHS